MPSMVQLFVENVQTFISHMNISCYLSSIYFVLLVFVNLYIDIVLSPNVLHDVHE